MQFEIIKKEYLHFFYFFFLRVNINYALNYHTCISQYNILRKCNYTFYNDSYVRSICSRYIVYNDNYNIFFWFHFYSDRMRHPSLQKPLGRDCSSGQTGARKRWLYYTNRLRILGFYYHYWEYGDGVQPAKRAIRYIIPRFFRTTLCIIKRGSPFNPTNLIVFQRKRNCKIDKWINFHCEILMEFFSSSSKIVKIISQTIRRIVIERFYLFIGTAFQAVKRKRKAAFRLSKRSRVKRRKKWPPLFNQARRTRLIPRKRRKNKLKERRLLWIQWSNRMSLIPPRIMD